MPEGYPRAIEVERVINVVQGFGWSKVSEELKGGELFLTIKKKFEGPEAGEATAEPT